MKHGACWTLGLMGMMASPVALAEDSITPVVVIPSLERLEAGLKGSGTKHVTLPSAWLKSLGLLEVVNPREPVTVEAGDLVDKVFVRDVLEPWWQRIVVTATVRDPVAAVSALPPNGDMGVHEVRPAPDAWYALPKLEQIQLSPGKRVLQDLAKEADSALPVSPTKRFGEATALSDVIVTGGAGTLRNAIGLWSVRNSSIPSWVHSLTNDIDDHFLAIKFERDRVRLDFVLTFIEGTPLAKVTNGTQSSVGLLDWLASGDYVAIASVDPDSAALQVIADRLIGLIGEHDTSPLTTMLRMMRAPGALTAVTYAPQVDPSNVGWLPGTMIHWTARTGGRPNDTLEHFHTMVGTWGLLSSDDTDGSSWSAGALGLVSTPVDTWEIWPATGAKRSRLDAQLYGPAPGARGFAAVREDRGWITLGQHQGNLAESLRPTGPRGSLAEDGRLSAAIASLPPDCAARLMIDPAALVPLIQRRFPETPLTLPEFWSLIAVGLRFENARLELSIIAPKEVVSLLDQLYPEIRRELIGR